MNPINFSSRYIDAIQIPVINDTPSNSFISPLLTRSEDDHICYILCTILKPISKLAMIAHFRDTTNIEYSFINVIVCKVDYIYIIVLSLYTHTTHTHTNIRYKLPYMAAADAAEANTK